MYLAAKTEQVRHVEETLKRSTDLDDPSIRLIESIGCNLP